MRDRSRQASSQVVDVLRQRILSLELKPNEVLSRAHLQEQFGVSQTPVRDALLRLEQEGLIEVYPQSATLVSRIDVAVARQSHFLRMAIELEAVRELAAKSPEKVALRLRSRLAEQERFVAPELYEDFVAADWDFHHVLYEEAGIEGLWDLVRQRSGHFDRLRRLNLPLAGKVSAVMHDHESLVLAIERGDPEGAAAVLRRHLSGTLAIVSEIRIRYPEFLTGD